MLARFKQRSHELERLDTGDYTPDEYAKWQREMRFIQGVFGESRALRASLLPKIRGSKTAVSILDVGAGSGELLHTIRKWRLEPPPFLAGAEINADAAATILDRGIVAVRCDALKLPFEDGSFDFAVCSLFLHHLTDDKAIELLREMKRVARRRIVVIDLHRSPIAYYFYKTVGKVFLQRFTVEDGSLSILRAFKPHDLKTLALKAQLMDVDLRRSAAYRLVLSGK